MSLKAMVWAFGVKCPSPTAKLVLVKICENANEETMTAWPSREHIARQVQVSTRTVTTTIQQLADAGLLSVEPRYVDGRQTSNTYRVHYGAGEPIDSGVKDLHAGVKQFPGGVENLSRGGGSQLPAEPSIEPVIEPRESQPTKKRRRGQAPKEYDEGYEQLWRTYPLRCEDKVAKADIYKHWQDAIDDGADPNVIVLSASQYARAFGHDEYRKGLRAWLRNRAFEQETPKPNGTNGAGNAHRPLMPGEW